MRLAYASEAESRIDRINRKFHKLEAKLGEDGEKPKCMRWGTFERICEQLEAADQAWGRRDPWEVRISVGVRRAELFECYGF